MYTEYIKFDVINSMRNEKENLCILLNVFISEMLGINDYHNVEFYRLYIHFKGNRRIRNDHDLMAQH